MPSRMMLPPPQQVCNVPHRPPAAPPLNQRAPNHSATPPGGPPPLHPSTRRSVACLVPPSYRLPIRPPVDAVLAQASLTPYFAYLITDETKRILGGDVPVTEWSSQEDTRESVADLVGAIVKQKKEKAAEEAQRAAETKPRSLLPVLVVLAVIAVGLTVWNVTRGGGALPQPVSPAQRAATGLVGKHVAAQAVNAYRDSTGVLPLSLEFVAAGGFGVTYSVIGASYVLSAASDTGRVTYRSDEELPDLTAVMAMIGGQ